MYERAEFAQELGSGIVMIDLVIGYTAIQSMAKWARRNDMILHLHRAGHWHLYAAEDAWRVVPRHRQMDAARRRRPHPCRHGRRQARGRSRTPRAATTTSAARTSTRRALENGVFFDQHWASLNKLMPVASGGIHAGQMHQLLDLLGEDVVLQFGGGTIGHPDGHRRPAHRQPRGARSDDPRPQRGPRLSSPKGRRSSTRRRRPACR